MADEVKFYDISASDYEKETKENYSFYKTDDDKFYLGDLLLKNQETSVRYGNSNLTNIAQYGDIILGEAATKGVTSSITADSTDLPTSAAVVSYLASANLDGYLPLTGGTLTGKLYINLNSNANPGLHLTHTGSSGATYIQVTSWTGSSLYLGIDNTGSERGVYDATNGSTGWLIYKDSSDNIHLGNISVGAAAQPMYLNNGIPTRFSTTIGASGRPVYLNSGTITQCSSVLDIDISGAAETLGSSNVGSTTNFIFLKNGAPLASEATIGSATHPIYLNNGVVTAGTSTVGSTSTPVYLNSGTITACSNLSASSLSLNTYTSGTYYTVISNTSGSVGYSESFVNYLSSSLARYSLGNSDLYGELRIYGANGYYYVLSGNQSALAGNRTYYLPTVTGTSRLVAIGTSEVGSSSVPVYVNANGVVTACTSLSLDTTGSAASATTATKLGSSTVGSGTKPIYLSSGSATASSATAGSASQPIYLSSGTLTACSFDNATSLYLIGTTSSSANTIGRASDCYITNIGISPKLNIGTSSEESSISVGNITSIYWNSQGHLTYGSTSCTVNLDGNKVELLSYRDIYVLAGYTSSSTNYAVIPGYNSNYNNTINFGTSDVYWRNGYITQLWCVYSVAVSDEKAKDNIVLLDNNKTDNFIDALVPHSYYLKEDTEHKKHIGFIAQEVKEALDISGFSSGEYGLIASSVSEETGEETFGLVYAEFIPLLVQEIQELRKTNAEFKEQIDELQSLIKG